MSVFARSLVWISIYLNRSEEEQVHIYGGKEEFGDGKMLAIL